MSDLPDTPGENGDASATALPLSLPLSIPTGLGRRKVLCSVLFLDLVDHSLRPVDEQVSLKAMLNGFIAHALEGVGARRCLALDTGDGVALCFPGDPQDALATALRLGDLLDAAHRPAGLQVRSGLHLGPVRIVPDINHRLNVIGDAINVAHRVMDFARANEVLASRAFRDAVAHGGGDRADLFCYAGPHLDKHGRIHELHLLQRGAKRPATGTVHIAEAVGVWHVGAIAAPASQWLLRLDGPRRRAPAGTHPASPRRTRAPAWAEPWVSPAPPAPPRS